MRADRVTHRVALPFALLACLFVQACVGQLDEPSAATAGARKVIVIISDGMDDQQITIARNYLVGSSGRLTLDALLLRGAGQVQTVDEGDPGQSVYVANTAPTMATGELTSTGRIATRAGAGEGIVTIMELARAEGLGTGIVTSSNLTDATPAAFIAHANQRLGQAPVDIAQGAEQPDGLINRSSDAKTS